MAFPGDHYPLGSHREGVGSTQTNRDRFFPTVDGQPGGETFPKFVSRSDRWRISACQTGRASFGESSRPETFGHTRIAPQPGRARIVQVAKAVRRAFSVVTQLPAFLNKAAQIGKVRKTNPRMRPARARPRLDRDRPRPPIVGHAKSSSCPGPRRGANNAGSSSGHVSARRSRRPPRFVQMRLTCFLRPHSRVFPQATPAATERS